MNCLNNYETVELRLWEESLLGEDYYQPYDSRDHEKADDIQAIDIMQKKVKRNEEGTVQVPLPWKNEKVVLPTEESKRLAISRARLMEKHMARLDRYNEGLSQVKNLISKKYASEMTEEEAKIETTKTFYIPIFFVMPLNKRMRMIWDAAAKIASGICLNSFLLAGPNLYNGLLKLLMQMRQHNILVKGDIQEMFHRIEILEDDRDSLRFFFADTPGGKLKTYRMNRLIFGLICSPFISQYVLKLIANDVLNRKPLVADAISSKFYVDDFVKSYANKSKAVDETLNLQIELKNHGMNIVKLNSTDDKTLRTLKMNLTNDENYETSLFSDKEIEKLLGYVINFNSDTISLFFDEDKLKKVLNDKIIPTKKFVLSVTNSPYDPCGFFQFVISKLKLIYHRACEEKLDWKDQISHDLATKWYKITSILPEILKIEIPRLYAKDIENAAKIQLWIFCDSGKEMMCNIAYIRCVDHQNMQTDTNIIGSKTHVVPSKQKRSIPDLEWDAICKAVQYCKLIKDNHTIVFHETVIVTDSACAYFWATGEIKNPTTYVRNRENKIKNSGLEITFRWTPTDWQPADYGTKMKSLPALTYNNDWFTPKFFACPEESWPPSQPPLCEKSLNITKSITHKYGDKTHGLTLDIKKFSTLNSAISKMSKKVVKPILKLKIYLVNIKIKKKLAERSSRSTVKELSQLHKEKDNLILLLEKPDYKREEIITLLVKQAQTEVFNTEINTLLKGQQLSRKHPLAKLNPEIIDGLLVSSTRAQDDSLMRNKMPQHLRRQIILPNEHHLTDLIILHEHTSNFHSHEKTVLINLLAKYFILHPKWKIMKVIKRQCYECKRRNFHPATPAMGNLPMERLCDAHPAFSNVILDTAGPFIVTNGRKTEKRWLFMVSCLASRGIHIEVMHSLTGESALIALNNTCTIRGSPLKIFSDQGTNFKSIASYIQDQLPLTNDIRLRAGLSPISFEWEFSPAKAPAMNGSIERMIGLLKKGLRKLEEQMHLKLRNMNDEEFRGVVYEILGFVNNRPLCVTKIGEKMVALTPNHFLMARANYKITPNTPLPANLSSYASDLEKIKDILWRHWLSQYIPTILYREKWVIKSKKLKVNDIVLTADPTISNSWRLGRILEIKEGSGNQVRKIKIMLGKNDTQEKNLTPKQRLTAYKKEAVSIIERPATAVSAIDVKVFSDPSGSI
jgi:transposase InsO family protein